MNKVLKGVFLGVFPIAPYGYFRSLSLSIDGREQSIHIGFKKAETETKHLQKGDRIEIHYVDFDNFSIRKI